MAKKINYKKYDIKDILIRTLKTFIQGFLASFMLATNNLSNFDKTVIKSALIGAVAGGISAVMNFAKQLLDK